KRKFWIVVSCCLIVLLLAACSQESGRDGGNKDGDVKEQKDPITLTIYAPGVSPEEFDRRWRDILEDKFSYITFIYHTNTTGNSPTEIVARGEIPDIWRIDIPGLSREKGLGVIQDMSDLVKEY